MFLRIDKNSWMCILVLMIKLYVYRNEIPKESYDLILDGQNFIQLEYLYQNYQSGTIMILACEGEKDLHVKFCTCFGSIFTFRIIKERVRPREKIDNIKPIVQTRNKGMCRLVTPQFATGVINQVMGR